MSTLIENIMRLTLKHSFHVLTKGCRHCVEELRELHVEQALLVDGAMQIFHSTPSVRSTILCRTPCVGKTKSNNCETRLQAAGIPRAAIRSRCTRRGIGI